MARYRDAAQRLVRSPWAHHCIRLLADALLRQGTIIWWFVRLSLYIRENNWTPTKSDFSRRDYSSCFGGSSYQTEMAITATLRFTGLPVR
jgi:hypothetical protein